ncbi:Cellulase domain-containing protein [Heracleum sosnowskyi]|uniref:Cellulase domain-containing protein n=1 Tax=Heracleum sosnowskyi TaxID=360622 RepID=A0AAD8MQB1_9APIA|nr:Cellulase domain-containing protein [Heracleum sosnowskyi]
MRSFSYSFLTILIILHVALPSLLTNHHNSVAALPLSTDSRWIVNESGQRVKLSCVNWATHMETMLAEGLSKQSIDVISKQILSMGFNCVRLTWPLYLFTNDSLANLTVRKSFQNLGLFESVAGIQANNPSIIDLSLMNAYQAVVSNLDSNNVMIILDNHISKPGWCCSDFDGNGFFGDVYFKPEMWLKGLTKVATTFNLTKNVVGMSLRNELRGPKQNSNDWYRYMQQGAEAVHLANPNLLVIVSGLSYDRDLSFLQKQPLKLTFTGKVVFEAHWYAFSDGSAWIDGNPNQVCGRAVEYMMNKAGGFLLAQGYPLFVSEFGIDQRETNDNDNRYFDCFLGWAAEYDLDSALWTLAGSYYLREGVVGREEFYGLYDWNWGKTRNPSFLQKIAALQSPLQGPGVSNSRRPHKIIYHPASGLCVLRKSLFEPLKLGPCSMSEAWEYSPRNVLTIKGTYFCLQADKIGKPAKLSILCNGDNTKWEAISDSKMHLASKLDNGSVVCLDVDSDNSVITDTCKCLNGEKKCDPGKQWFKIVNSTHDASATNSLLAIKDATDLVQEVMLTSF